ncbi:MAG: hypothetical protein MJ252_22640 [archaeon]|nr:hypothetical protein [archaeon]
MNGYNVNFNKLQNQNNNKFISNSSDNPKLFDMQNSDKNMREKENLSDLGIALTEFKPKGETIESQNNLINNGFSDDFNNSIENIKTDDGNHSDMDEVLKKKEDMDLSFINFYENFTKNNPLEALNKSTDNKEVMMEKTKDITNTFIDYQSKYYQQINKELERNKKFKELLQKNSEKYINALKDFNTLSNLKEENEIQNYIDQTVLKSKLKSLDSIIETKVLETNLNNEIFNIPPQVESEDPSNFSKKDVKNLLIFTIQNLLRGEEPIINEMKGALNNNINSIKNLQNSSFTNEEIDQLKLMNRKYNLAPPIQNNIPLKPKDKKQFLNIITSYPDEIDYKMENYLDEYYNKHKALRIPFKKTSKNNYEYGTQKIVIKMEGNNFFRVKYSGGYISLDKFIEVNSNPENIRLKNKANSKKKVIKKK